MSSAAASSINTAKVAGRRKVRLNSIDEALAEIERIAAADRAGTLRHIGNWSPGQALGHIAAWIEYGYDGYPMKPPPWFLRVILRLMVKRFARKGLPSGVKLPNAPGGTFGIADMSTTEGATRLRAALERMRREPAKFESPGFGPVSDADRIALNLRHAELHLSFIHYP